MIRGGVAGVAIWVAATAFTGGCAERAHTPWEARSQAVDSARADTARPAPPGKQAPAAPKTRQTSPVDGWRGPGDQSFDVVARSSELEPGHARRFGSVTLQTALRARPLGQYPCTSCHLGRKVVMADKRVTDAHQNIQPVHPKQTGALCSTCHAADNVELLALEDGKRASLDESYRLCAECHFAQVGAWAAGAHGKRLDGWQGRRVVMACPDCHDPHKPALQPRIPFRAPRIERIRASHP
jgi:hypothetical protein